MGGSCKMLVMTICLLFSSSTSLLSQNADSTASSVSDTVSHKGLLWERPGNPWGKDKGWWFGIGGGFHTDYVDRDHPDQGPFYKRLALLMKAEYRLQGPGSFPIELQWWGYTLGTNPDMEQAILLSVSFKLRVYFVSHFNTFGQAGVGIGRMTSWPYSFPFAGGVEFPIREKLCFSFQIRQILFAASGNYWYLVEVTL
jgi:hypothetical protein